MGASRADRQVTYAVTTLALVAVAVVAVNIKPIPLAAEVKVTTDPPGAQVLVDGRPEGLAPLRVYVNPGQHRFQSRAAGYEPSAEIRQNFEDGGSGFVDIKLTPIPPSLEIVSDLTTGTLNYGGGRTELIPREGDLRVRMPVTAKSIELAAGNVRVVAPIEIKPGQMPEFNGTVLTANSRVVAIAWGGGKAYAEASVSPVDLYVDGKRITTLVAEGRALPPFAPGVHRIRTVDSGRIFERPILISEVPGMALLVSAEQNVGNLMVTVNVEGARILLDGAEFRSSAVKGENFIANLRVRVVMVEVKKDGYAVSEPKPVQLRRGETVGVTIELQKESVAAPAPQ